MLLGNGGRHRADIDDFLLGREREMPQGQPRQPEDDQKDTYKGQGFHHAPSRGVELLPLTGVALIGFHYRGGGFHYRRGANPVCGSRALSGWNQLPIDPLGGISL